jgi:tetratricopeptide (TPR) repeat protein
VNKKPIVFFILLFSMYSVYAQNTIVFPRLEPEPRAYDYYRLNKQKAALSWTELAEISLWASGNLSQANLEKIRAAVESLNKTNEMPSSGREKAEFILTFMHRNILKSYSLYQTRIDTIFSNGSYNCVSSAVLYMILCTYAGIDVSGIVTKDHALAMVHINGEDIDVETTNRYGFDPGNKKEFNDQFGKTTGFAYVPARNYRDRQTISKIELISLIFNNRISDNERQNRYSDSLPLALDMTILLAGEISNAALKTNSSSTLFEDPNSYLMDRIFNYGTWLLRLGREEDCLKWAASASTLFPDTTRWQEFIMAAVNNRISKLLKENKLTDARNFLEVQKNELTKTNYVQLDNVLTDAELLSSADRISSTNDGNDAISAIERNLANGKLSSKRALELITFAVQKTASLLCAAPGRDWRSAINYIENALNRFGANRELEQALGTYRSNLATEFHNRFAVEWNKKKYDEAESILNEGLAEFPNDRQLLADMETMKRQKR